MTARLRIANSWPKYNSLDVISAPNTPHLASVVMFRHRFRALFCGGERHTFVVSHASDLRCLLITLVRILPGRPTQGVSWTEFLE